jgi:hypothetical protein
MLKLPHPYVAQEPSLPLPESLLSPTSEGVASPWPHQTLPQPSQRSWFRAHQFLAPASKRADGQQVPQTSSLLNHDRQQNGTSPSAGSLSLGASASAVALPSGESEASEPAVACL